jgi:hypothetical protein
VASLDKHLPHADQHGCQQGKDDGIHAATQKTKHFQLRLELGVVST